MFFVAGLILTQSIAGYFMLFIGVGLVGFILQKKAKFRIGILGIMLIFLVAFIVDMLFFNTYLLQLILWLLAGVAWWVRVAFLAFFKPATSTTRAKIYTLCILMPVLHSSVDYPLRTIAISAVLAFFAIRVDRQLGAKA